MGETNPQNGPGARYSCNSVSWVDSGDNLWLFRGRGYGSGSGWGALNDHCDTTWTWISGSNTINQTGTYETMGTYSANNRIGGRYGAGFVEDVYGNYWIFGGKGYAQDSTLGYLNDLWMVDPQ